MATAMTLMLMAIMILLDANDEDELKHVASARRQAPTALAHEAVPLGYDER